MNEQQAAILKTSVYFDIFDYPLTLMELWRWLNITDESQMNHGLITDKAQITHQMTHRMTYGLLTDILETLGQMTDKIQTKGSFYFLKGREEIVLTRLARYNISEQKFKRAIKFIKIFRFIPFIKMMAVCNNLAYSNCSQEGDIDLFIIAKSGRLWLTRFLVVGLLKLLGVRPSTVKKQDTIDANFFLSEDNLNLESIKIGQEDIYLTYWTDQIVPIYDRNNTYQKFQKANQWVKKVLPNTIGYQLNERRTVQQNWFSKIGSFKLKLLLNWQFLENLVKKYQLKIIPKVLKEMMNQDTRVIVNEKMLKFHRNDRRGEYQEKFKKFNQLLSC